MQSLSARDQMETRSKRLGLTYSRGPEGMPGTSSALPATHRNKKAIFPACTTGSSLYEERKYGARDTL